MSQPRAFRFGVMLSERFAPHAPLPRDAAGWADKARRIEADGYSVLTLTDHADSAYAPLVALASAAAATTTLRLGTMVLAADLRHVFMLAKETATLSTLSGGRFELGIGAGWDAGDYAATGQPFLPASTRIDRLHEYVSILRQLWTGETVEHDGEHLAATVTADAAATCRADIPMLIGGGGRRILTVAAELADIVGVNVPIKGGAFTPSAVAAATDQATRERIAWIRAAAGNRFADLELSVAPLTAVTDDPEAVTAAIAARFGQSPEHVQASPLFLIGSISAIADRLHDLRETYGFSHIVFTGGAEHDLAPLVNRMAGE